MQKSPLKFLHKESSRAKQMRLSVHPDGRIILTTPYGLGSIFARRFIESKTRWLISKLKYFSKIKVVPIRRNSRRDYLDNKDRTRFFVLQRIEHFNKIYNFKFNRIAIRNQKSRWGSCSKKGNLNFNYKLIHMPTKLADLIIVHELCHLKELNHSKQFWSLVAIALPNYVLLKKELGRYSSTIPQIL